ncbi:MAG: lytic transglycosylase [Paenibacillaceae bacterium]|jgi:soluble lytic murein transglycosylase|nr:lytic transglycosylase [Paenibacillaceae bacterium]
MSFLRKKRVFALLLIAFLAILFFQSHLWGKWLYPIRYQQEISFHANQFGVDPLLIASIIRVESNFKPDRVSNKGAVGLMQIMPDTAEWMFQRDPFRHMTQEHLVIPADNIQMGTWYVQWLLEQFKGNVNAMLAAYNAGPGNAGKWLENGDWDGTLSDANRIPFGETRHFVTKVNYYYSKYAQFYKEGLGLQGKEALNRRP